MPIHDVFQMHCKCNESCLKIRQSITAFIFSSTSILFSYTIWVLVHKNIYLIKTFT